MLEIRDLHVQFHGSDHEAVRGIDLTVGDGEIVGLVGESGSGKTVTAMMISGLLRPEQASFRGKILLDGRDLLTSSGDTLRSIQGKDICVVFQEPMSAMDPTMRIGPQVEEALVVHTKLSAEDVPMDIVTLLVKTGLAPSKSEARRLVQQNSVSVNNEKVTDIAASYTADDLSGDGLMLKKGKKVFHRAVLI